LGTFFAVTVGIPVGILMGKNQHIDEPELCCKIKVYYTKT